MSGSVENTPTRIHPSAYTVMVTAPIGGAGKTTTAAAVALSLHKQRCATVLVDIELDDPNPHVLADPHAPRIDPADNAPTVNAPRALMGYSLLSPTFVHEATVDTLIELCRRVPNTQAVVFDTPAGWGTEHDTVMALHPDVTLVLVPPTPGGLGGLPAHLDAALAARGAVSDHGNGDASVYPVTRIVVVETLATTMGYTPSGEVVIGRRGDAVDETVAAETFESIAARYPDIEFLGAVDAAIALMDLCTQPAVTAVTGGAADVAAQRRHAAAVATAPPPEPEPEPEPDDNEPGPYIDADGPDVGDPEPYPLGEYEP